MVACVRATPPPVVDVGVSLDWDRGSARITPRFKFAAGYPTTGASIMSLNTAKKLRDLLSDIIEIAEKRETS